MNTHGGRRRGDCGDTERGAALVEMSFTIVLLVMLLVGVVTSAVALGQDNSIENAAREASRFGATLPGEGDANWFDMVRDVARAAATGDLEPTIPNQQICIAYIDSADTANHVIDVAGAPDPVNPADIQAGKCPGFNDGRDGNGEARVNVVTQRDSTINALVFSTDVTLQGHASARYERESP